LSKESQKETKIIKDKRLSIATGKSIVNLPDRSLNNMMKNREKGTKEEKSGSHLCRYFLI